MAPGVTLAVIGAILTFAVRSSPNGIINLAHRWGSSSCSPALA